VIGYKLNTVGVTQMNDTNPGSRDSAIAIAALTGCGGTSAAPRLLLFGEGG
jgi:hypothetical protein